MNTLPVSVVIVARNAEDTIEDCLISVASNDPAEVIIVDGNSTDRTVDIASKYTALIFSDEGQGLSYARHLGAQQVRYEYISYVDSDIILPPHTLATMLNELKASDNIAISAQQIIDSPVTYWERALEEHIRIILSRKNVFGIAACLLKKETILKYPFDTNYPLLDDIQLQHRLLADGHKLGVSSALAYHCHPADLRGFAKQRFVNGRGTAQFLCKYGWWHPTILAPLKTPYMLGYCLMKSKPHLVPYFLLGGIFETAGLFKGFYELTGKALRKNQLLTTE